MEMNKEVIDNLWTIVAGTEKQILVMEIFGDLKAYLVDSFFNEVRGAQDITDMVLNLPFQLAELNPVTLNDRVQGRPKKDFKFGKDNYMWMISNKKNEY